MKDSFITNIFVKNSRNIKDLQIALSKEQRQHLIITGKNGSGKTSLLLEINKHLQHIDSLNFNTYDSKLKEIQNTQKQLNRPDLTDSNKVFHERKLKEINEWLIGFGGTSIEFSNTREMLLDEFEQGKFILAFFDSRRHASLIAPRGINKIELKRRYGLNERVNSNFLQYIVNLKADRSFAKDDNEEDVVRKIDEWFEKFERSLKLIFNVDKLQLKFNRNAYNFDIVINDKEIFGFDKLSDGYSAIISIITELILRMDANDIKSYDLEGIVIIDEIETHLHVDLQKKILPFLTDFFPKLQFIVTTHSPFVLSSLSNAKICDLETKVQTTDLSGYSYDALIESYFESDKYSDILKNKIKEFEELLRKQSLTQNDEIKKSKLKEYLFDLPKYLSKELYSKLLDIEINYLTKNNE